ncbi:murein biosynthesis integral membrane protein MurJ [Rhizobacter sp. Root404]|uniref:murein biosynthesis integral membrane protein MurJ n=1 Tax=Rhizobacter sp. Root404 TaxID=1736528 RepID=UPI0006F23F43|nr:murein biosynthesis integral membrane protein MurJ [Rhizobacter sp. Root404]KQW36026.1 murein biosynthesis protein MurJ [Rhizobacter sp. Root404]
MNLLRAASTISLLTLVSRISGLARDVVVAGAFGNSAWMDAYNVAFRIPNFLRRLFGEGAFQQAFVPVLGETRARDGDEVTRLLIDAVATILFWTLVVTCVVGVVAAPLMVWLMAAGLQRFDGAVVMTQIMFPYIGLISMVSLAAGVLNTWKQFVVPAATPVLLNLASIGAALWLGPWFAARGIEPIYAQAVGVMIGGVLQLAIQVPALKRVGAMPHIGLLPGKIRAAWGHPGVGRVMRQMAPALLGVSVAQISVVINTQIASHQGVGAVSSLDWASRLMEFPTALLGVALGVVLIPQLSAANGRKDTAAYSGLLDWGLRLVLMLALPCAVALLVFPNALLAVLFQRGAFDAAAVHQTALALMGYGVGLMGLVGVKILAPGYYARQDTRTPVKIAIAVLVLTQLMNALFVPFIGHAGLALSISLGAMINAFWLFTGLKRSGAYTPEPGWWPFTLRVVGASALLGALLFWAERRIDWVGLVNHQAERIGWLALCLGGAAVLYFTALLASGLKLQQFMRRG